MKTYLFYKDKSVRSFKRISSSGYVFDKYRPIAASFIRYAGSDLDSNLALYGKSIDIENIRLESVFPAKYKWLVRDVDLKSSREYLENLESRVGDFKGKEENFKLVVGVFFIKFVLITKIVETYLASAAALSDRGVNISDISLESIGIGNNTLKYFEQLEVLTGKTIDEWIAYTVDPVESKYFYSSMKRILTILVGDEK